VAELARARATITIERSGTVIVDHAPPAAPHVVDYPNDRAALAIFRKRVAELVGQGWQLSRGDSDIGSPVAREPRMEEQLRGDFSAENVAIYDDWLIENGDPCGELSALRLRGLPTRELETARAYELFGAYADVSPHAQVAITALYTHGWVNTWRLDRLAAGTLVAFALLAPIARFVHTLQVGGECHLPTLRYALLRSPQRRQLRTLDVFERASCAGLLDALPALETVTLPAGAPGPGHAHVRSATLEIREGQFLLDGAWPALEHLTLRGGPRIADLLDDARLERYPRLTRVEVDGELDARSLDRIRTRLRAFTT
jgi:hypothetical protein